MYNNYHKQVAASQQKAKRQIIGHPAGFSLSVSQTAVIKEFLEACFGVKSYKKPYLQPDSDTPQQAAEYFIKQLNQLIQGRRQLLLLAEDDIAFFDFGCDGISFGEIAQQ